MKVKIFIALLEDPPTDNDKSEALSAALCLRNDKGSIDITFKKLPERTVLVVNFTVRQARQGDIAIINSRLAISVLMPI
jgi:hypothetical protein